MSSVPSLSELLNESNERPLKPPKRILTVDPGGTVGWSLWENQKLLIADQFKMQFESAKQLIVSTKPDLLIIENYRLYPWVNQDWSEVYTPRVIGVFEYLAFKYRVRITYPNAERKSNKLYSFRNMSSWGVWQTPNKPHANDAVRHGIAFYRYGANYEIYNPPNQPILSTANQQNKTNRRAARRTPGGKKIVRRVKK